jgi:hypothetical protein
MLRMIASPIRIYEILGGLLALLTLSFFRLAPTIGALLLRFVVGMGLLVVLATLAAEEEKDLLRIARSHILSLLVRVNIVKLSLDTYFDWSSIVRHRATLSVGAFALVEAAMWTLTENLPHWFLWATIPLGLVFVLTLNLIHEQASKPVKIAPWAIGLIYLTALSYAFVLSFRSAIIEQIETSSFFYRSDKQMIPMVTAIVTLTNEGPYVSNAHDFILKIHWKSGETTGLKAGLLDKPIQLPYINGRIEQMLPEDDLSRKAFAPIAVDNQVRGRLIFQGWQIPPERFRQERPAIEITGIDSHGKLFRDIAAHDETGEVIVPPYGEYPGMHQRFLR